MDDDTLYKIAYWEIPGKHRSPDTFFRFCLGATAAIYMFDGIQYSLLKYQKDKHLKKLNIG